MTDDQRQRMKSRKWFPVIVACGRAWAVRRKAGMGAFETFITAPTEAKAEKICERLNKENK